MLIGMGVDVDGMVDSSALGEGNVVIQIGVSGDVKSS